MGYRKEYLKTMQLTKDDLLALQDFNRHFRKYGLDEINDDTLTSFLGSVSTIFSLVCLIPGAPTALSVAGAIAAVFSSLGSSEKDLIIETLRQGEDGLGELRDDMNANPEWDMVEAEVPMLEFVDEKICCVQGGKPNLLRVKIGNVWLG